MRSDFSDTFEEVRVLRAQLEVEVAERRRVESELRALFAGLSDSIAIYDRYGRCLKVADTHLQPASLSAIAVQNKSVYESLPKVQADFQSIYIQIALDTQEVIYDVEYKLVLDGQEIWLSANVSPLSEHTVLWAARNITPYKLAERSLQRSNLLLQAHKEVAIAGILAVDEVGQIVSYNRRFCEMWDIPESLLCGKAEQRLLGMLLAGDRLPEPLILAIERTYDRPDISHRECISLNDGRVLESHSSPVTSVEGKLYGTIWYFRDARDGEALKNEAPEK